MKHLLQTLIDFWPSILLLGISAIPAAYMVLHDTGKAKWFGDPYGYFGEQQWIRKYKSGGEYTFQDPGSSTTKWIAVRSGTMPTLAPDTWYYRFFKLKYEEWFLFSATFLISFTDCYHTSQLICRVLMSLSITLAISAHWWFAVVIWALYATVHAIGYKLLSR